VAEPDEASRDVALLLEPVSEEVALLVEPIP